MGCGGRDLIERIITLGFYYRELDRFATKSRNLSWIRSVNASPSPRDSEFSSSKGKPSVYRRAIANGIVEILAVYRSAVLHIEQKLLAETVPILATVTQGLNKVFSDTHFFSFLWYFTNYCNIFDHEVTFFFLGSFLFFCRLCMS